MQNNLIQSEKLIYIDKGRAGVIPFTIDSNKRMYFLLAKDSSTMELGDFGGGCKKKRRETLLDTAIREFKEETSGVFSDDLYSKSSFHGTLALVGKSMVIVFLPLSFDNGKWFNVTKAFKSNHEISDIVWVDDHTFRRIMFTPNSKEAWSRIRNCIQKSIRWHELCTSLRSSYERELTLKNGN